MKENIVQKLTSKDDKYACAFTDRIVAESHDTDEDRHGPGPQDRQLAMTPMEHPEIEIVQIRFNYVDYEDASRCFRNLLFYL